MGVFWVGIYLLAGGIIAGLLATMAGLASLVSYPLLLSLGVPPVNANVTNTAALIWTGVGSALSSRKELKRNKKITLQVTIVTLVGGIVGSLILVVAPAKSFEKVVPFFIFAAGVLMLWTNRKKRPQTTLTASATSRPVWLRWLGFIAKNVAIFLVGVYIGYFGASAGVIMLAILGFTLNKPFAVDNAIKNFAAFATNVFSLIVYTLNTRVYWGMAVVMGIGFFIGGYLGPIFVRHVPTRPLRMVVAFLAFGLAAYFFYQAYF